MAVDFTDFTTGGSFASDNYLVGYDVDASGGEKKWKYDTLMRSISSSMTSELVNKSSINVLDSSTIDLGWDASTRTLSANANYLLTLINTLSTNMQNIGNYPYLEYAWATTPLTTRQLLTESNPNTSGFNGADYITVATLNTLSKNDSNIAYIDPDFITGSTDSNGNPTNNTIRLLPGTYHIRGRVNIIGGYRHCVLVSLKNNTKSKIEANGCIETANNDATDSTKARLSICEFETVTKVTESGGEVFQIEVLPNFSSNSITAPVAYSDVGIGSNIFDRLPTGDSYVAGKINNTTPKFDHRVVLMIWKVG